MVFVGIVTVARISALNRENFMLVVGMNRLRHAYLELYPELAPYFVAETHDDVPAVMSSMGLPGMPDVGRLGSVSQGLQTLPAMVSVILAVVIGVLGALITTRLGGSSALAIIVATLVFMATNTLVGVVSQRGFFSLVRSLPARFPSQQRQPGR